MLVCVGSWHHHVEEGHVSAELELLDFGLPFLPGLVFLKVIVIVVDSQSRGEGGSLEQVFDKRVKEVLGFLIETGTHAPSEGPSENGVKILTLLLFVALEAEFGLEESLQEIANTLD